MYLFVEVYLSSRHWSVDWVTWHVLLLHIFLFHTVEVYYSDVCCFLFIVVVDSLWLGVVRDAASGWRSHRFLPVCLQASSDKKSDWRGGKSPASTADQFPTHSAIFLPFLATRCHFLSVGLELLPPPPLFFIFLYPICTLTNWKPKRVHSREPTALWRHLVVWRCRWTEPAAVVQVEFRF